MSTYTPLKSSWLIKTLPFFYGWIILIAGTLGIIMIGPSQTFTVGVFIDSFIAELGISRANISLIYGLSTLAASLMLPLVGRWLDRYGAKRVVMVVTLGLGLACLGMSQVQGIITLFVGLWAISLLGFGALQMASNNIIAQWFIRQRGLVMGLAGQSLAISLLIYPPLAEALIDRVGWRDAWSVMAILVWLVMLPVGWFFFKDKPEPYGLQPDGDSMAQKDQPGWLSEINWTLDEAWQTRAFWIFAAALSVITMIVAGLVFHQLSLFEVRGLDRATAINAFNIMALFSIIGNLGLGHLLDRFSARLLLSVILLLLVVMMILVQVMNSPAQAFIYSSLMGLVSGGYRVMDAVVWAKYYGRQHLGAIKGATMLGVIGATALGPYPLGLSFDYFGSYGPILTGLLILPLGISVMVFFVKRPQKPVKKLA
jgi:MFS family permease